MVTREFKQKVTIRNEARGTAHTILVNRNTGRLSRRQERETFLALSVPGFQPAGPIGEHPLIQAPPEFPEELYVALERGERTPHLSHVRWMPIESAREILARDPSARCPAIEAEAEVEESAELEAVAG